MSGHKVDVTAIEEQADATHAAKLERRMRLAAKSRALQMATTVEKAAEMGTEKVLAVRARLEDAPMALKAAVIAKQESAAARREEVLKEKTSPAKLAPSKARASMRSTPVTSPVSSLSHTAATTAAEDQGE